MSRMDAFKPEDVYFQLKDLKRRLKALETAPRAPLTSMQATLGSGAGTEIGIADALQAMTSQEATIAAQESRTSAAYGDLGTVGPTVAVSVSNSGNLLVVAGCKIVIFNQAVGYGKISYAFSGGNTLAADDVNSASLQSTQAAAGTIICTTAVTRLHVGLTPGPTTVTMKYAGDGSNLGIFAERFLFAIPL